MAATNISAALATVITSLPYSVTVSAADLNSVPGTPHTLWWKYTNTLYRMVSQYAQGTPYGATIPSGGSVNIPQITLWTGSPGSLSPYPPSTATTTTTPTQTPFLSPGTTIYIQIDQTDDGSNPLNPIQWPMTFQVFPGPLLGAPTGSLLIPDFNTEFPSVLLGTNGQIRQTAYLDACDFGAILDDGTIGLLSTLTNPPHLKIYGPTGAQTFDVSGVATALTFQQVQGNGTNAFFVGGSSSSSAAVVKRVNATTGAIGGTTWTLPANSESLRGMAPNRAETILYYSSIDSGSAANNVYRYDISGAGAAMSDLAGNVAGGYLAQKDMFVTKTDGNILVGYRASATDAFLRLYNPAGAVLMTYTVPSTLSLDRFAMGTDDPDSFWWWTFLNSDPQGTAVLQHINSASGNVIESFEVPVFTDGNYGGNASNNPPRFGISNSCPLLVIRAAFPGTSSSVTTPSYSTTTLIPRRQRTGPHLSDEQQWIFYPEIQLDMETGVGLTTGQGSDPTVMFQYSDDGGHTWSMERWKSAGKAGHWRQRVRWLRNGRSRDRVPRVTVSDPVPYRLISLIVKGLSKGT